MTPPLFDKDQWDDEDCIRAWDKLCSQHTPDEIFWAMYGGLLKKELKLRGSLTGLGQHDKETPFLDIDLKDIDFDEACLVRYEPDFPIEALRKIVESFTIPAKEEAHYRDIYTEKQLSHAKMQLELILDRDE